MKTTTSLILFTLALCCAASAHAAFDIETKLTANDAGTSDEFGRSVGISGNTAIV
jgi:hypothetical protein